MSAGDVTAQLRRWNEGDRGAFEQLTPLVYEQLRSLAGAYLRREQSGHTWQATELVNELFIELLNLKRVEWQDRAHFFAMSARLMRRILVDHARAAKAEKRGADLQHLPLNAELAWVSPPGTADTLDLDSALDQLMAEYAGSARAIEFRHIFGFTAQETAELLGSSKATVDRDVCFGLAWLYSRLHPDV